MRRQTSQNLAIILSTACFAALSSGCGSMNPPLDVVEEVDIERYLGRWYEIARYPHWFETDCVGVTAEYSLREDGRIRVLNTCIESTLDGPERVIEGTARVVDPTTNAKLKVAFFGPFEGDFEPDLLDPEGRLGRAQGSSGLVLPRPHPGPGDEADAVPDLRRDEPVARGRR